MKRKEHLISKFGVEDRKQKNETPEKSSDTNLVTNTAESINEGSFLIKQNRHSLLSPGRSSLLKLSKINSTSVHSSTSSEPSTPKAPSKRQKHLKNHPKPKHFKRNPSESNPSNQELIPDLNPPLSNSYNPQNQIPHNPQNPHNAHNPHNTENAPLRIPNLFKLTNPGGSKASSCSKQKRSSKFSKQDTLIPNSSSNHTYTRNSLQAPPMSTPQRLSLLPQGSNLKGSRRDSIRDVLEIRRKVSIAMNSLTYGDLKKSGSNNTTPKIKSAHSRSFAPKLRLLVFLCVFFDFFKEGERKL